MKRDGFTMLEMLISMVIFTIVVTGIFRGVNMLWRASTHGSSTQNEAPAELQVPMKILADVYRTRTARFGPAYQLVNSGAWNSLAPAGLSPCRDLVVVHNVAYAIGASVTNTVETVVFQTVCGGPALPTDITLNREIVCQGGNARLRITRTAGLPNAQPSVREYPASADLASGLALCFRENAARQELLVEAHGVFRSTDRRNNTLFHRDLKHVFSTVNPGAVELTGPPTAVK